MRRRDVRLRLDFHDCRTRRSAAFFGNPCGSTLRRPRKTARVGRCTANAELWEGGLQTKIYNESAGDVDREETPGTVQSSGVFKHYTTPAPIGIKRALPHTIRLHCYPQF
jgi:hypothetical protein